MASRPHQDYGGPSTSRPSTASSGNHPSLSPSASFGSFMSVRPRTNQLRRRSHSATAPISIAKSEAQKDRVPMACTHCRTRKVRCDGGQPTCGLCGRLGRVCSYAKVSESENVALRARKKALRERRAKEADMNRGWAAEALQSPQIDGYSDVWPPGMGVGPSFHPHSLQHHHQAGSSSGSFPAFPGPTGSTTLSSPPFEPISHEASLTSPYSAPDPSHPDSPLSARRVGPGPYPRMGAPSRRSPPERPSWFLSQLSNDSRGAGENVPSFLKSGPTSASFRSSVPGQMSTSTLLPHPGPHSFDEASGPKISGGSSSSHGLRGAFGSSGSGLSDMPPYGGPLSSATNAAAASTTPSVLALAGSGGAGAVGSASGWQHQQPSGLALPESFGVPGSSSAWSSSAPGPHLSSNSSSDSSPSEARLPSTLGPWRGRAQTYDQPHPPPFIGALEHGSIGDAGGSSARDGGSGSVLSRAMGQSVERASSGWGMSAMSSHSQMAERATTASMASTLDYQQVPSQPTPHHQSQHPHQPPPPPQQLQPSPPQHHAYSRHGDSHSGQGSSSSSMYAHPQPHHHHQHHSQYHHPSQAHHQHQQQGGGASTAGSGGGGSGVGGGGSGPGYPSSLPSSLQNGPH